MKYLKRYLSIALVLLSLALPFASFSFPGNGPAPTAAAAEWDFQVTARTHVCGDGTVTITKAPDVYIRGEFYWPESRKYTGIPAIEKIGNRLWAFWQTGGNIEPHPENYLILAYSDDGGLNWKDSFITVEGVFHGATEKIGTPLLHADNAGKLWLFFFFRTSLWTALIPNPSALPKDITWDDPVKIVSGGLAASRLTVIKDQNGKEEWFFGTDLVESQFTTVYSNRNDDKKTGWNIRGFAETPMYGKEVNGTIVNLFHEAMLIKKRDGNLWMLKRLEKGINGGIEQSFSSDNGRTWTDYECDLPEPLIGPGSKFYLGTLSSGNILFISHASKEKRTKLIAHLSTDDGATWPYSLMLDERTDVSYPDAVERDGKIYVAYDKGRYNEKEIRMAVFTEEDLMAGAFISEGSVQKRVISKCGPYVDMVSVLNASFSNTVNVKKGTSATDIIKDLPQIMNIKDENGNEYQLQGHWEAFIFVQGKTGSYTFNFKTSDIPAYLVDTFNLLKITVNVTEDSDEKGCNKGKSVVSAIIAASGLALVLFVVRYKKY